MAESREESRSIVLVAGQVTVDAARFVGGLVIMLREVAVHTLVGPFRRRPIRLKELFAQCLRVGPRSLGVVFLVNFFVGVILALLGGDILRDLGVTRFIGDLMGVGIVVELGPLLTGVIMTGYIGAALAAEIATMVVREETTALKTMALDPVQHVVAPRVLATVLMVPCVTMLGCIVGLIGGALVAVTVLHLPLQTYLDQAWNSLDADEVWKGLLKSVSFGAIIGSVGCYMGFRVKGGAEGVGRVTTNAVVSSIITIIITDAILNYFLLFRL
jgi:phospholipid/cholesterol/gamma-HCH transport system permease protein